MSEVTEIANAIALLKGAADGNDFASPIKLLEERLEKAIRAEDEARETYGTVSEVKL